ncbi:MAG: glycosyltransferase [Micrococcus sp.]|nr:glycosyltransferase [Micrococcus sp.]
MRLLLDARYTRTDFHDGISRYGASLAAAAATLARTPEWSGRIQLGMLINDPAQLRLLPNEIPWHRVSAPTSPLEPLLARQINPLLPDVVFSPMQTMGTLGRRYGQILTLHDLIYYEHPTPPSSLPEPIRWLWRGYHLSYTPQRLLLNRADRVATVSATTAGLIAQHRLTRRPVDVIANAAQPVATSRDPEGPRTRDLVYMGSFMSYKDVESLLEAVPLLPGYTLHLLSRISPARRAELEEYLVQARRRRGQHGGEVTFHGGVSDEAYTALVAQATALVTLSRAEGFGLPVAEAMAQGTPVIGSAMPIFEEIGGTTGGFLPVPLTGDRGAALAQRVRELDAPGAFARASRAAVAQAATFSWEASARALFTAARQVHAARGRERRAR